MFSAPLIWELRKLKSWSVSYHADTGDYPKSERGKSAEKRRKRECVCRDNPAPYATVRCNENGIQKSVYNSVLFIKGNLVVGKIHIQCKEVYLT